MQERAASLLRQLKLEEEEAFRIRKRIREMEREMGKAYVPLVIS
jgi:hypothetical protein